MPEPILPPTLVVAAQRDGRADWLTTLGASVGELAERWSLRVGVPFQPGGATAWVAPAVVEPGGQERVLKLVWPHAEAAHEADGLLRWAGHGTVLLHDSAAKGDGSRE